MAQQHTISKNNTIVSKDSNGATVVTLHQTPVVVAHLDGRVTLNSGGWPTDTTKTRMNQASNELGLGYRVFQKKGEWYVERNGFTKDFHDGMVI